MRIRSVKPEFWRSEDIASLSIADRLLFIGLWSYVDDSGVGVDRLALICADLFALDLERDPEEVYGRVRGGLQELSNRGLITRYEVDGKRYLHITKWQIHQRIEKPTKSRYTHPNDVLTCTDTPIPESSGNPPGAVAEESGSGAREQGNRGTGEQGNTSAPRSATDEPTPAASAAVVALFDGPPPAARTPHPVQVLVGAYDQEVKRRGGTASNQFRSRIGSAAKRLLADGIPEPLLLEAVITAARRGRADIDSILAAPNGPQNAGRAERDRMFARWDEIAEQFDGRPA